MTRSPLHRPAPHESGERHVSGRAIYVDDLPNPAGLLRAVPILSPHARARILRVDAEAARALPGVGGIFFAGDVPGHNDVGPVIADEPLLAAGEVYAVGQYVGLVVAESEEQARRAAAAVVIDWQTLPAIVGLGAAIAANAYQSEPLVIARGDVDAARSASALVLEGVVESPGQEHFYLEGQVAMAVPEEDGTLRVYSSTQHPSEVQAKVAEVLGLARHRVAVETTRLGGGFGGKESQAAAPAALAALAAVKLQRPIKMRLDRRADMTATGKRHPFRSEYRAGFDADGRILALEVRTVADGGWSLDLSKAILQRCLFHLDNAYFIPAVRLEGRVAKTNVASNTAFRGFGGPQGMMVIEAILDRLAGRMKIDPAEIRRRNLYAIGDRDRTPYGQVVENNRLPTIVEQLLVESDYPARRQAIEVANRAAGTLRRGIALMPVKFGISFTTTPLNQAGALVLIYGDGSVQVNHGGVEMGQGLQTKIRAIAAHELGIEQERIRVMPTATEKVPNTSATAASSGTDLNGAAVREACATLRARLLPFAAERLKSATLTALEFRDGGVVDSDSGERLTWPELAHLAWLHRVSLAATGYYATPGISFDAGRGQGRPFHYFAFGAAVVEVEVSGLTGEWRLQRVDILHDVGKSLVPTIDIGQIEGGFLQGVGWLGMEELVWSADGRLLTRGPSTYKIPAVGDAPADFRVRLDDGSVAPGVIHGSKAVGEPPLMLAIGLVGALRHAIGSWATPGREVELRLPATPEAVLRAIEAARGNTIEVRPTGATVG